MASAYLQMADCLVSLDRIEDSLVFFKKSISFQRGFPNVRTLAPTKFGLVVVERELKAEYTSALEVLDEFDVDEKPFPLLRFWVASIRAIIWSEKGDPELARKFACLALIEARKEHSGFRYHSKSGLVGDQELELRKRVEIIAQSYRDGH